MQLCLGQDSVFCCIVVLLPKEGELTFKRHSNFCFSFWCFFFIFINDLMLAPCWQLWIFPVQLQYRAMRTHLYVCSGSQLISPPLWFRLKYLNNYWMARGLKGHFTPLKKIHPACFVWFAEHVFWKVSSSKWSRLNSSGNEKLKIWTFESFSLWESLLHEPPSAEVIKQGTLCWC